VQPKPDYGRLGLVDENIEVLVSSCGMHDRVLGRGRQLAALPELIFLRCFFVGLCDNRTVISDATCLCGAIHMIGLLTSSLFALSDVSPRRTATAETHLYQPSEDGKRTCNPHERKQRCSDIRMEIYLRHTTDSIAKDDEHDGSDNGSYSDEEGVEKGEDGDDEGEPS